MSFQARDLHRLALNPGSWMSAPGPESDVAVSCRVRLARNLEGFPFVTRLDEAKALQVCERLKTELGGLSIDGETRFVHLPDAPPLLRLMLRERHLASRDLSPSEDGSHALPGRAVAFGSSETTAVMVNEEDHLRLTALAGGFQLELAWQRAQELDQQLEQRVGLAFTRELGYLTACPTNVGTGLRASVMLHLPALALVRSEIEKVFAAAQRTGLAVRGLYGEGSRAVGDFYQVSNQITLGRSETQLVADLKSLAARIIEYERQLRSILFEEQKAALRDRVGRSLGILRTARSMPTEGALAHLSNVRLGVYLRILRDLPLERLNALTVQVQKAHIQALSREDPGLELLDTSERDQLRAAWLRQHLAERDP